MKNRKFFKECRDWWREGYFIPVRSLFNHHLIYEFLSNEEKEQYEQEFGEKVLSDANFLNWYVRIKK